MNFGELQRGDIFNTQANVYIKVDLQERTGRRTTDNKFLVNAIPLLYENAGDGMWFDDNFSQFVLSAGKGTTQRVQHIE